MPKKVSKLALTEQPINWGRAILCGMIGALFMMSFIDTFYMMGITPFCFELYLGSLIRGTVQGGAHNWIVGFFANLVTGGLFGLFYAYCFEDIFQRSSARLGIWVGVWHTIVAAVAVFPFFGAVHEFMGTGLYPEFGILGVKLGLPTTILLVAGHMLFGSSMGLFYGGVRERRVRERYFEPGESGRSGSFDVITPEYDPRDRVNALYGRI
jgi:hypothetical protein